ncbi:hypothetical protein C3L33_06613, partial [Rhododendron williamsianum]
MEALSLSVVLVFLSLVITVFAFRRRSHSDVKLPPGSFGWPILGETMEFLFGKPENFVGDRMKKYSHEIFKTNILGEKTAVICGPKGNKFLFSNEEKLFTVFRPHPMQMLFRSYKTNAPAPPVQASPNDDVKSIRTPGFFKPEALMRYLAKMDSITQQQLDVHWEGLSEVKVFPLSKIVTLTLACRFFLGIDNPEQQLEISKGKKAGELLDWEDLSKMKYSWNVMSEVMRLVPPLQGTFREALCDFTYAGYTIPKGWKVYWTVSSTNKNPMYFKEPEKFNPSRYEDGEAPPPYTYVPFGGGPRLCPGKEYARLAVLTFIHNVVKRYKWEVLFPDEKIMGDMMPTPEKGLPIRLTRC